MKKHKTSLTIMRAQPFHKMHEAIIRKMLDESETITILIGSAQESGTERNPFTYEQRRQMIENVFHNEQRLTIKPISDLGDYSRWANFVITNLGFKPDAYYCGSDQDKYLFQQIGVNTVEIDRSKSPISATKIRETLDMSLVNPVNKTLIESVLLKNNSNFARPRDIPSSAKIIATTGHYDIWQYPVELPNGGNAIYEMCTRQNAAIILAEQDGKIVFSKQTQRKDETPMFCMLGGMIEKGESPLQAAKRELAEESGLSSTDWEFMGEIKHVNRVSWSDYVFLARNCKTETTQHLDAGENIELVRTSVSNFMSNIILSENFREKALKEILIKKTSAADIAKLRQFMKTK